MPDDDPAAPAKTRESPDHADGTPGRSPLPALRVVFAIVVVASISGFVATSWSDVVGTVSRLDGWQLVGAVGAAMAGVGCAMLSWRACMRALGAALPLRASAGAYFVGQLAKYVPGSVWAVLAQADLAARHGVGRAITAAASLAQMLVSVLSGMLVGGVGLLLAGPDVLAVYWWFVPVSLVCGIALWPPLLQLALRLAGRVLRREALQGASVRPRPMLAATAWCVLMWVCFGAHFALLVAPFAAGGDLLLLAAAVYAFAWVVGFLIVFLPAGAGAREGVLVLALGGAIGAPIALSLALVSRFAMLAADLLVASLGSGLLRRSGVRPTSARSSPPAGEPEL